MRRGFQRIMASVNKQSLRQAYDTLKGQFETLCAKGKMGSESRALFQARDWEHVYGHRVYYLESFVDPERFQGRCYRAAHWLFLGRTTGRGKPERSRKAILAYPLTQHFRHRLCRFG